MLIDCYFLCIAGCTWKYTLYLWSIKETELSAEKFVIDVVMVGCGLASCLFTAIVANIFVRRITE